MAHATDGSTEAFYALRRLTVQELEGLIKGRSAAAIEEVVHRDGRPLDRLSREEAQIIHRLSGWDIMQGAERLLSARTLKPITLK